MMDREGEQSKRKGIEVILMAKPPEIGEAKTRLSLEIGDKTVIKVYSSLLKERLSVIEESNAEGKTIYTYGDENYIKELTSRGFYISRDIGDYRLQDKVYDAFRKSLNNYSHSLMIVSDDPSITTGFINFTLPKVSSGKLVISPTRDGGLYLIGISENHLPITEGLPFGKPNLCNKLIRRAINKGFSIEILPQHIDIDSADDMESHGIIE